MSIKIVGEENKNIVHVSKIKNGQVAKIVKWGHLSEHVGAIVFRHLNDLSYVDPQKRANGYWWPNLLNDVHGFNNPQDFIIEILPAGTKLEITLDF